MIKTLAFLLSASLAACAGQAEVRYSSGVTDPDLVAMDTDPSVMVVANADEPVFYIDSSYWLYRDNRWYRSSSHRGGWARVDQPPEHVRRIERPEAYVHFRHNPNAPRTTYNERDRYVAPPRTEVREPERRDQTPPGPAHEPNPQGPEQPYPNPRPPQQVPPESGPRERPDHQVAPDPDRAPISPGDRDRDRHDNDRDHRRPDEPH